MAKAKTTKKDDLKGKSEDELKAMLIELRKEQMNLRFQRGTGQLEKTHEMRKARRQLARVKTFLSMKKDEKNAA